MHFLINQKKKTQIVGLVVQNTKKSLRGMTCALEPLRNSLICCPRNKPTNSGEEPQEQAIKITENSDEF